MAASVILLVEDEADLLTVMSSALGHSHPSLRVESAQSAEEAQARLDHLGPADLALAIVDYQLGERTGLQLLSHVREAHPDAPTLMVTGQAPAAAEREARDIGARVLWKPLDLAHFMSTVEALLRS